ncbi:uncharacterized protein LOC130824104 isoform X2 [Amaranthus tricolor]|uniref:uncharacterized protein LOC130824104 isoform X2 n=1 Tax=Amaranthus tricolor TaxID=29722 RepID=UPI00258CA54F|nr:uncharacterized protein LOC130824104 isoform X2 [Amaranthus tricolor]
MMNKLCSFRNQNIHVKLLLAALMVVSMVVNSECRPVTGKEFEEEEDKGLIGMMKWANRDEMVYVAGYGEDKLSNLLITGTLVCNKACLGSKHGIGNNNHHLHLSTQLQPISATIKTMLLIKGTTFIHIPHLIIGFEFQVIFTEGLHLTSTSLTVDFDNTSMSGISSLLHFLISRTETSLKY